MDTAWSRLLTKVGSLLSLSKQLNPIHVMYTFMRGSCIVWQATVFESPVRVLSESQVELMNLNFYNSDIHRASFALPQFVKKVV